MAEAVLQVRDLDISYSTPGGPVPAVAGLSFDLEAGQTLALVGESGSGKSATAWAIMGLLPASAQLSGSVAIAGREVTALPERQRRAVRGKDIGLVFQDSLAALSPYSRIGAQLVQAIRVHEPTVSRAAALVRATELLDRVRIPEPSKRVRQFPHELSGGMRQRVGIAMALVNSPAVLVADEPTTALDMTVQAQILDLLRELQRDSGMAILLITHDLGVVARAADRVLVLYAGREVESGATSEVFQRPAHPYTAGLRAATLTMSTTLGTRLTAIPGTPASLQAALSSCAFQPRCPDSSSVGAACVEKLPVLRYPGVGIADDGHRVACHLNDSPSARAQ